MMSLKETQYLVENNMALIKICDNCGKKLGGNDQAFLQLQGSLSEQVERSNGTVSFRYLTKYEKSKMVFCDDKCENKWKEEQRKKTSFTERSSTY